MSSCAALGGLIVSSSVARGIRMPFRANLDILRSLRMIFGRPVTIQPQDKSAAMH
jgi:hypothetical protein